ncbi:MAG TPA: hypothetical protein VFO30_06045 [Chthoniobacterales bacterium]|nr:hypothetical protein [Chthoniobacterales bacterium]
MTVALGTGLMPWLSGALGTGELPGTKVAEGRTLGLALGLKPTPGLSAGDPPGVN